MLYTNLSLINLFNFQRRYTYLTCLNKLSELLLINKNFLVG